MDKKDYVEEMKPSKTKDKTRTKQILTLILLCCFPLLIITGCGISDYIQCTIFGDDSNKIFVYASGTDNNNFEYKSCVGPAGILGFGCDSKCWPTECVSIKGISNGNQLSGCVTYYNGCGCIENTEVKSSGKYSDSVTCAGIECVGKEYIENAADTTKATEATSILGISCRDKKATTSRNLNSTMPRAFYYGCWSCGE